MEDRKGERSSAPDHIQRTDTAEHSSTFSDDVTAASLTARQPIADRAASAPATFRPNELLAGRFKVIRFIGRGGMGEVYEAEDAELNERVAIKTARFEHAQTAREVERFRREIQLARRVTHPNVCRTFDVFRHVMRTLTPDSSQVLIVSMELLIGDTLHQRIREPGRFSTAEALPLVDQLCAGLGAAHQVGVIHRDFKSSNVILVQPHAGSAAGQQREFEYRAVITDFGLAHAEAHEGGTLTRLGDFVGTPAYMAPEQIEGGAITPATDIYALGIVMYEMLTGELPFSGQTPLAAAIKRLSQPAPSPRIHIPDLNPRWEIAIAQCLEREPERRYASTADVIRELHGGESVAVNTRSGFGTAPGVRGDSAGVLTGKLRTTEKRRFARWQLSAAAIAIVIALVGLGIFMRRHAASQTTSPPSSETAAHEQTGARKSIAILGFQNLSGRKNEDSLGNILADSLWSQLDTGQIRFIPTTRVEEMKQNLGLRNVPSSLTIDQAKAIHNYLGADVLVTGSYTATGSAANPSIEWNIHLLKADGASSLGSISQSGNEADLNGLVIHSGRLMRQQLGINLSAAEEARMDASLSTNPDAMRDFSEARKKLANFEVLAATRLLEKSIDADPKFAQAHSALSESWDSLGFETKAAEEAKKALDAKSGLSTEARSRVTAQYYAAMRDWPNAIQQYAQLWTEYRDEPEYGLLLANTQIRAGKAKDALTTIEQLRTERLPDGIRAQADLAEARAQGDLADYKKELALATSAAQTAQTLHTNLLFARARILQCFADISLGEAAKAQPLCEEAKNINMSAGDDLGAARATNDIANAHYYAGDYRAAEPLYEQALSIAQTIGDAYDEAGALNNLANIQSARGDHVAAVKTYEQAIAVARARNETGDAALAQQNMAIDLYAEGNRARGNQMFSAALKSSRELNDRNLEARILNNMCATSLGAGALPEARKSCEGSLKIRRDINDRAGIGKTLATFGSLQLAQADLSGARQSLNESLTALESAGAKSDAAYTRISLAQLSLELGDAGEAAKYAGNAATELAAENDTAGEAEAHVVLARAMLASGKIAAAHTESATATRLAQQSGDRGAKLDSAIVTALTGARSGTAAAALKSLESAQKEARAAGLIETEYDARLALGETQMEAGHKSGGRATLQRLAHDAEATGFRLVARNARAASEH